MKPLALIFSAVLLALPAPAQRGGGGHSGGGHSGGGGGHFGGGHGGGFHEGHGGFGGHGRGFSGYGGGGYGGGFVAVPSVGYYPSVGSGYTDTGYAGNGYADNGIVDTGPAPSQEPANYSDFGPNNGQPSPPPDENGVQPPAQTPQQQAMADGRYYLIAYKDHSIVTALAFWTEKGVLNYVTPENAHNQVTLDLLDLDLTKQLNQRRGMAFSIASR